MNDDMALVREYAANQSEPAFETLVSRHVNLVHSAALRQLRDPSLAEEITQTVFVILARKAGSLSPKTILPGWLYRTTRYVSAAALKIQHRRERREQEAHMLSTTQEAQADMVWEQLSPLLDEAMAQLRDKDRDALVLRYFQNKSLRDVGMAFGVDEYAAQKRVGRALEKLRQFFSKRGVASTTVIIAGAISANSVQAAPVVLATSVAAAAITKGAAVGGSTLTLIKGALSIMAWTKAKTAAVVAAGVLLAAGTTTVVIQQAHRHLPKPQPVAESQTEFPRASWRFAGNAEPESALLTAVWAVGNGDVQTLWTSFSPAKQEQRAGQPVSTLIGAKDKADFAQITGYRILDKQVLSEKEVLFTVYASGLNETQQFALQRIGNEWKFGLKPKR